MGVTISCRAAAARPFAGHARARGAQILRALGLARDELSLSLVDDAEIRGLNAAYRGRDRATDVLAFALTENAAPDAPVTVAASARRGRVLGDVVISIDHAAAQARADRVDVAARLDALLVHGILHLVGYDHERSAADERRMRRKEREVRAALATARPRRRLRARSAVSPPPSFSPPAPRRGRGAAARTRTRRRGARR